MPNALPRSEAAVPEAGAAARRRFTGHVATTSAAVRVRLDAAARDGLPVVADLSLGSWQAMSVARQLAGQLGIELSSSAASRYLALGGPGASHADLVSHAIDMESLGHRVIDTALDLAARMRRAAREAPIIPVIIPPRFGAPWEDEDVVFLTLLARELGDTAIRFLCCHPSPPELPELWSVTWDQAPEPAPASTSAPRPPDLDLLSQIPQVVPEALAQRICSSTISNHIRLPTGWIFISPEARRAPAASSRLDWDRFASAAAPADPSLAIYGQYHGNHLHLDTAAMTREAWRQFAGGGTDIALRYLQRVERCEATQVGKAIARAQQQSLRIAQLRYAEAAEQPEPSASLPPALQASLWQAQGWGLVLTGRAARARELLQRARALLGDGAGDPSREMLYLLNILALAEIRCGDIQAALQLEQQIAGCLDRGGTRDHALRYVNAINLARIYKKLGDWTRSAAHYDQAFATSWGVRSESDLVYSNVCRAILHELQAAPSAALAAWVRAALHWLASSRPEALSFRIAQAVAPGLPVFGPLRGRCVRWVDEISAALLQRLAAAAAACGRLPRRPAQDRCPRFVRADDVRDDAPTPPALEAALAGDGWSVFAAAPDPAGPHTPPDRGPAHAQLRAWIAAWIATATGPDRAERYVVDARGGREVAVSRRDVIELCARRGVRRVRYDGEVIAIDDALAHRVELESTLGIAPGVDEICEADPPRVRFKRYREPRALAPDEAVLIEFARRGTAIAELRACCPGDALGCLEPLERAGVVERTWSDGHA